MMTRSLAFNVMFEKSTHHCTFVYLHTSIQPTLFSFLHSPQPPLVRSIPTYPILLFFLTSHIILLAMSTPATTSSSNEPIPDSVHKAEAPDELGDVELDDADANTPHEHTMENNRPLRSIQNNNGSLRALACHQYALNRITDGVYYISFRRQRGCYGH